MSLIDSTRPIVGSVASDNFEPTSTLIPASTWTSTSVPTMVPSVHFSRPSDVPQWLPYVSKRLAQIGFPHRTTDIGSATPRPSTVFRAFQEISRFMDRVTPTPSVVPTHDGAIMLVWHKGGWDIEVEIGSDESAVWADRRDGSDSWEGSLDECLPQLKLLLRALSQAQ